MTRSLSPTDGLIVVDVQNDFCAGGALSVPGADDVVAPINGLMPRFGHVVLTQDWHPAGHASFASSHPDRRPYDTIESSYGPQVLWPDHCVAGSAGADFHPRLDVSLANLMLRKGTNPRIDSYSAFRENDRRTPTGLAGYLRERGVSRVFLAGVALDYCVLWSAEDARYFGLDAVVIGDACRALDIAGSLAEARRRLAAAAVPVVLSRDLGAVLGRA